MDSETRKVLSFLAKQSGDTYAKDLVQQFQKYRFRLSVYEHLERLEELAYIAHSSVFLGAKLVAGEDTFGHCYRITVTGAAFLKENRRNALRSTITLAISLVSLGISIYNAVFK